MNQQTNLLRNMIKLPPALHQIQCLQKKFHLILVSLSTNRCEYLIITYWLLDKSRCYALIIKFQTFDFLV